MSSISRGILLSLALGACKAEAPKPEAQAAAASAAPAAGIDENLPPGDGPVAKVGDVEISRAPFLKEYRATLARYAKAKHGVRPGLRERLKNNIVQRLVDAELIAQQAKSLGVTLSPEEGKKAWEEYCARYGDEKRFQEFLDKAGSTAEDMEQQFLQGQLRERVFEKIGAGVVVTPEQVKAFYEENKAKFVEPEQVKASHILFQVKNDASAEDKAAKRALAEKVLKQLKAGADFAELARAHSNDGTAQNGGDLGWFPKDRMVKPFEDAAFALKDGQLSGIVESPFGFHIIKRTGYRPGGTQSFDELKERLTQQYTARERQTAIREALERWRKETKIELFLQGDPDIIAQDKASTPLGTVQQRIDGAAHGGALKVEPIARPDTTDKPAAQP